MSESDENGELGALARSIDALFSGRKSRAAADEDDTPPVVEEQADAEPEDKTEASGEGGPSDPFDSFDAGVAEPIVPVEPTGHVESTATAEPTVPTEPPEPAEAREPTEPPEPIEASGLPELSEPVEPLEVEPSEPDGPVEPPAIAEPPEPTLVSEGGEPTEALEPTLSFADLEVPQEVVWESVDEDPAGVEEEALEVVASSPGQAPEQAEEPLPGPPESPDTALAEAVDAFLAGHRGARREVESLAVKLQERLALDPLADAVERLVEASEGDEDDPALDVAAKITNPAVASRLVQRMAHEDDEERRAAYIELAKRLGIVMANAFKGALTDAPGSRTRQACLDGLIAMDETSRPVIEAMVEDENRFLVQNGVAMLGELGGEGALELVTSALADTDFRVRREALVALGKLGGEESMQLIMASLEDSDATVRAAAAEAAGRLGIERALRPMLALLDDHDLDEEEKVPVQVQALRGLGFLGDPGAVQAIEKLATGSLLSKPSIEVRVAAYQALHRIGTPHARQVIEKAHDDKDPVVRTTVRAFDDE